MRTTLAVLITYYNERHLVGECLASLLAQPEPPDEILIYDDASRLPARDYVPPAFPVRIIRDETNRGPAHGRNALLRASRADYIHFHDSDDLFHHDWCRQVRAAIAATGADAIFSEITSFRDAAILARSILRLRELAEHGDLLRHCLQGVMLVPSGTYRRAAVERIGGYRERLWQAEDFDFHARLAASGVSYALLHDALVFIRVRRESRSQNQRETLACMAEAVELLAAELPTEYRPYLAEIAAYAGSGLFKAGERRGARAAFRLAWRLGPPTLATQRRFYRGVARRFGPEAAEYITAAYRALLPERLRRAVVATGW